MFIYYTSSNTHQSKKHITGHFSTPHFLIMYCDSGIYYINAISSISMATRIAEKNLERDRNVQGKNWLFTYSSYFSDEENIQIFIDAVASVLSDKELDILYVGSASGLVGERLITSLGKGKLTLVDISQKHLNENINPTTTKICADILELNLEKTFDLIIMRSSLDYFPSKDLQIQVLKIIKNHLTPNGLFINQPAYIPPIEDRNLVSNIYNQTEKMGDRFFQSTDMKELYIESGFSEPQKIGDGKVMYLTEQDHIQRYELTYWEVKGIQDLIKKNRKSQYALVTSNGYKLRFEFPIFLSK